VWAGGGKAQFSVGWGVEGRECTCFGVCGAESAGTVCRCYCLGVTYVIRQHTDWA
jgi:hypothetical protein